MSTCSKVLSSLIISRIRGAYDKLIMNSQFGFRANRSTTDAIFVLQNSINMTSKPLFLRRIDLKATGLIETCFLKFSKYVYNHPF